MCFDNRKTISFYTITDQENGLKTINGYIDGFGICFKDMVVYFNEGIACSRNSEVEYILGRVE